MVKGIESLPQTMIFNSNIFATLCRKPWVFQTMNSDRSSNPSLKYHRFTTSGCKDIGIGKFECVTKTHFLYTVLVRADSLGPLQKCSNFLL